MQPALFSIATDDSGHPAAPVWLMPRHAAKRESALPRAGERWGRHIIDALQTACT